MNSFNAWRILDWTLGVNLLPLHARDIILWVICSVEALTRYARRKSFRNALSVLDGFASSDGERAYRGTPRPSEGSNPTVQPTRRAGISCGFPSVWKTTILGSTHFHADGNPSRTAPCTAEGLTPSISRSCDFRPWSTMIFAKGCVPRLYSISFFIIPIFLRERWIDPPAIPRILVFIAEKTRCPRGDTSRH